MRTSDKIKAMPLAEQFDVIHKLQYTSGEACCLNDHCNGEYYRVDKWVEDDNEMPNKGNTITIMMCYECEDILWIERDKNNVVVELTNTTK